MNENGTTPESAAGIEELAVQIAADVRRMREIMERLFGQQPEDPRYGGSSVYRNRG